MGKRDPRFDDYIAKSAEFARPILEHFREIVHTACPGVEETIKWGMPSFEYHGILCNMASFKAHCAIRFWKGAHLFEHSGTPGEAMGHLGRISKVADLPPKKELLRLVKEAARLNEEGVEQPRAKKPKTAKPPLETPDDLAGALKKNKRAREAFEAFPPSHRREYIEWITEAKTEATRSRRLEQAVEWMSEGKSRNWKYERK